MPVVHTVHMSEIKRQCKDISRAIILKCKKKELNVILFWPEAYVQKKKSLKSFKIYLFDFFAGTDSFFFSQTIISSSLIRVDTSIENKSLLFSP